METLLTAPIGGTRYGDSGASTAIGPSAAVRLNSRRDCRLVDDEMVKDVRIHDDTAAAIEVSAWRA
jgi:hypothetical protein